MSGDKLIREKRFQTKRILQLYDYIFFALAIGSQSTTISYLNILLFWFPVLISDPIMFYTNKTITSLI